MRVGDIFVSASRVGMRAPVWSWHDAQYCRYSCSPEGPAVCARGSLLAECGDQPAGNRQGEDSEVQRLHVRAPLLRVRAADHRADFRAELISELKHVFLRVSHLPGALKDLSRNHPGISGYGYLCLRFQHRHSVVKMFHCRHVFVDELVISVVNMRAVANDELIQVGQALSVP